MLNLCGIVVAILKMATGRNKDFNGNGYLQGVRHAAPYGDHFSLLWRPF
jgi:hypothetical protein